MTLAAVITLPRTRKEKSSSNNNGGQQCRCCKLFLGAGGGQQAAAAVQHPTCAPENTSRKNIVVDLGRFYSYLHWLVPSGEEDPPRAHSLSFLPFICSSRSLVALPCIVGILIVIVRVATEVLRRSGDRGRGLLLRILIAGHKVINILLKLLRTQDKKRT